MFDKNVYIGRRRHMIEMMQAEGATGIAIFIGNVESPAQYRDNCYKFRQDSSWLYLFGIDEPRYAATIDIESGEQTIYADDADLDDIIWNGPTPSVASIAASVGIEKSAPYAEIDKVVARARELKREIHFLPATRQYNAMKIADLTGLKPAEVVSASKAGCPNASEALLRAVISMRLVKEDVEIEEIDKACILGQEMHTVARRGVKVGTIEQQIVGDMEGVALSKGWGVSFATILTQHGEVFHCHSHEMPIVPGKLLVIDAGVESNSHYASDFTRTYPTGGKYTQQQREIYQIVCDANEHAFKLTAPGVAYRDVHLSTVRGMLKGLKELDLVRGDVDEMVHEGIGGLFMPHGLGHNMGLDVHDMEDYGENLVGYDADQERSKQLGLGSLRMARRLEPGNIVTDEPGIYFIPALIRQWKADGTDKGMVNYDALESYMDFGGIRLEDDVLVTPDGARRLGGKRLPISPDDVEAAMTSE